MGRFSLSDTVLSKSLIREGIAKHKYQGWDDVRLGTLRALRRRGFQPDAIRQIIIDVGPKPSDITISTENLAAYNRKLVDKSANRYFFIPNPKKIVLDKIPFKQAALPLHPDKKGKNTRTFSLSNVFYIDTDDYNQYKGLEVRLKDLCNVRLGEKSVFTGRDVKSVPKIQWVPAKHLTVKVLMPGREIHGYGEMNLAKAKPGEVVQFERFSFVKIDKVSKKNVVVIFGHK